MEWRDTLATTLEVDSYHGGDTLMDGSVSREMSGVGVSLFTF